MSMTDDEAMQWLSEDERRILDPKTKLHDFFGSFTVTEAIYALAETRKALAMCEADGAVRSPSGICRLCGGEESHLAQCIIVTMPRPRE